MAAVDQPILCAVDDAQWLDRESAAVLAFVARRLYADRIAMLFATREEAEFSKIFTGLPALDLAGIPDAEARDLLSTAVPGVLRTGVADQVVAAARGNPLAILEISSDLTPGQLDGSSLLPEPLPIGTNLRDIFLRRVKSLSTQAQTLLLLGAAEPTGDASLIWRAAKHLGVAVDGVTMTEVERLITLGPQVTFRHPLIRSAVYHGAQLPERRRIHEALAEASDSGLDSDQRAWHRAASAIGPDDDIAQELTGSAERARQGGGYAAAAAFLARAAELSVLQSDAAKRKLAAAQAELVSGRPERARALLDQASPQLVDPRARGEAQRLDGAIDYARGRLGDAPTTLLKAARMLEAADPRLARETTLEALQAAVYAARFAHGDGAREVAAAARTLRPTSPSNPVLYDLLLAGFASLLLDGRSIAVPVLRHAVRALQAEDASGDDALRWSMLGCLAASEMWDDEAQHGLASRWVKLARDRGALTTLPVALNYLGWYEVMEGRIVPAEVYLDEGLQISRAIGNPGIVGASGAGALLQLVWRGRSDEARKAAAEMSRDARERSQGASLTHANSALTVLELSLGNYKTAMTLALDVFDEDMVYLGTLTLPDLVEAAVRSGDRRVAHQALDRFRDRAQACGTTWALGVLSRSVALLTTDPAAEQHYREAIERLERTRIATDLARGHLLYGEWLRRQGRKRDARERLRTAHAMFESMGAQAFAERARAELVATGERVRKRSDETRDQLTPQESRIARLAGEGVRNQEIAAQLFISPSTVEYHLVKVFRKLGVTSRAELAHTLVNAR